MDTDLSFLRLLELYGAAVAERRMPARGVVEALDVVDTSDLACSRER